MKINKLPKGPPQKSTARYDGYCPGCGIEIVVGDDIFLVDGKWYCEDCSEEAI